MIECAWPQIAVCSIVELYLHLSSMYLSSDIISAHNSGSQLRLMLLVDQQHTPNQSHEHGAFACYPQQLRRSTLQGPVLPEYSPSRHREHTAMAAKQWLLSAKGRLGSGARTRQTGRAD